MVILFFRVPQLDNYVQTNRHSIVGDEFSVLYCCNPTALGICIFNAKEESYLGCSFYLLLAISSRLTLESPLLIPRAQHYELRSNFLENEGVKHRFVFVVRCLASIKCCFAFVKRQLRKPPDGRGNSGQLRLE